MTGSALHAEVCGTEVEVKIHSHGGNSQFEVKATFKKVCSSINVCSVTIIHTFYIRYGVLRPYHVTYKSRPLTAITKYYGLVG